MSSLRNAVKRKTHKERSQPEARRRLGLLEKHKDYSERTRDYHRKKEKIDVLKRKAAQRNPDEFAFGMIRSSVGADGAHRAAPASSEGATLSHAQLKLLKRQDAAYTRMRLAIDERKAERMQASLHLIGSGGASASAAAAPDSDDELDDGDGGDGGAGGAGARREQNRHTIFFEDDGAREAFEPAAHFGTTAEHASNPRHRPRVADDGGDGDGGRAPAAVPKKLRRKLEQRNAAMYDELRQRRERGTQLKAVLSHMEAEKHAMGKGRKRKVQDAAGGQPAVYKFKRQRQK